MKYRLLLIVTGIVAVAVFFFVRRQLHEQRYTKIYQTDKLLNQVEGEITEISQSAQTIVIRTVQKRNIIISLKPETRIKDEAGNLTKLKNISKGFSLFAYGKGKENEIFVANEVRVTKTPAIIVYDPLPDTKVKQLFTISGIARVFENVVSLRVTNERTGEVFVQTTVYANAPDVGYYGPYTYNADLSKAGNLAKEDKLILEVYQNSAKDGSEIDTVSIPIVFSP